MVSLPPTFSVGSFSSGQSVRDAFASYRRSQYFVAGSQVTGASDAETFSDEDFEEGDEETGPFDAEDITPPVQGDDLDHFGWEAEDDNSDRQAANFAQPPRPSRQRGPQFITPRNLRHPRETTPLLRKAISFSTPQHPSRLSTPAVAEGPTKVVSQDPAMDLVQHPHSQYRRFSGSSAKSVKYNYGGKSTFGQTLFNSIAILLGVGMLSEPLAFAYSGWVTGTILIIGYGFVSCYTAKILARIILADPRLRSYADIGRKAFGQSSMLFISVLFCLELFSCYSCHFICRHPAFLVAQLFYDNIQTMEPRDFSGHTVVPSLAKDMIDPTQFDRMINWAFFAATLMYTLIGYAGYLMFGNSVSEEISMDLAKTLGYNPILNQLALWMLVISPLSKFALATQPLNATIEILLGIDIPLSAPEDMVSKSNGLTVAPRGSHVTLKRIYAISQRLTMTFLSVMVSILLPDFGAMMAFLGAFAAFLLCIIGPISAKVALAGRCNLTDGILLTVGVAMAIWGTAAAFLEA
ncbi:hypothetical protein C0991_000041 [Blastosporella zonata]|nr:hypothetical protein C0991_000041 [Blastosporella zonata]